MQGWVQGWVQGRYRVHGKVQGTWAGVQGQIQGGSRGRSKEQHWLIEELQFNFFVVCVCFADNRMTFSLMFLSGPYNPTSTAIIIQLATVFPVATLNLNALQNQIVDGHVPFTITLSAGGPSIQLGVLILNGNGSIEVLDDDGKLAMHVF